VEHLLTNPDFALARDRVRCWLNWLGRPRVWGTLQMISFIPRTFHFSVVVYILDVSTPARPQFVRSLLLIKSVTSPLLVLLRTTLSSGSDHWELIMLKNRDMRRFLAGVN
jgi:hypothetical protein